MQNPKLATPAKTINVPASVTVTLNEDTVFEALHGIAYAEMKGRWIIDRKGKKVVREEVSTSHKFDRDADDQSLKTIERIEAANELLSALATFRAMTGRM